MTRRRDASSFPAKSRPGLRRLLYRGNFGVALVAVCLVGFLVILLGVLTLRAIAEHHLNLIARSMAYTVEAAVVFSDPVAAEEALRVIASTEDVTQATVFNRHGKFADWKQPPGMLGPVEQHMAHWLPPPQIVQPVLHRGAKIGELHLTGFSGMLLTFLLTGIGGMVACLAVIACGAWLLSRRLVHRISEPLDRLAEVAHAVRADRVFARRVPDSEIAELHQLGEDFNALLDELEAWEAHHKNERASLAHQATHDSLTNLSNRAFFEGRLSRTMRETAEHGGRIAVLFIDCDQFKSINDQLGHAAGDAVLVSVASRIRAQVRDTDLVARLGGDEFAVMLAPLPSLDIAIRIADDILASLRTPIHLPDNGSIETSLTIGIAVYPDHAQTPGGLLDAADLAMYEAKRRARGSRHLVTNGATIFAAE